jgi:hypothetical protein
MVIRSPFHLSVRFDYILCRVFRRIRKWINGLMAIHPKRNKLITTLRTAVEKGDSTLDKEATSHDELLDVFSLLLQF